MAPPVRPAGAAGDAAGTTAAEPSTPSTPAAPDHAEVSTSPHPLPERESCVKYFDALWWCYSPGHQLRQFYRHGNVDDCSSSWKGLWDCLSARTVRYKDDADAAAAAAAAARRSHPLWRLRTREEAAAWWAREFGHLEEGEAGGGRSTAGGGGVHASGGEATP